MEFRKAVILTEGYNFTNADEVVDAFEANQIGVKILADYKDGTKSDYILEKIKIFFKKCNELGVKNTTYGVQLLLSKCVPNNLDNLVRNDGFYELLKEKQFEEVYDKCAEFGISFDRLSTRIKTFPFEIGEKSRKKAANS